MMMMMLKDKVGRLDRTIVVGSEFVENSLSDHNAVIFYCCNRTACVD